MSGVGLTTGLCDAGALGDCFIGIFKKGCTNDILDKYAEIRRQKFLEITNPISKGNIERLYKLNPETAVQEDPFLKEMNEDLPAFEKKMEDAVLALIHGSQPVCFLNRK